jgi:hypothetical protein
MATPFVTGLVALMLQKFKRENNGQRPSQGQIIDLCKRHLPPLPNA